MKHFGEKNYAGRTVYVYLISKSELSVGEHDSNRSKAKARVMKGGL